MSLQASLNKYKSELADAATRNAAHARPTSTPTAAATAPASQTKTSRPPDEPSESTKRSHEAAFPNPASGGSGQELMTQVHYAVGYLKRENRPVAFDNIISYLSLPVDAQKNIPYIKQALQTHHRVQFVPRDQSGNGKESFKYRPQHPVTNGDELKTYLARMTTAQGIPVKELKDGWPDCIPVIDALEKEGAVLVTRNKKDNTPRMIWPDSPSFHIQVDQSFVDYWVKTKLPTTEAEIRNELEKAGLTPTSQVKETKKNEMRKKERKRPNRMGGKTTNNHMLGILKDYSRR